MPGRRALWFWTMREMRVGSGFTRPTPVVFATLITLLVIFVVSAVAVRFSETGRAIFGLLVLDPALVIAKGRVWTLVSYALLHSLDSPLHLVFNGLALYFFGPTMESRWGARRFLLFMFVAALVGGLFVLATYLLGLGGSPVYGASAITMGLVVAWGLTYPDREVYFFFFPLRGVHLD
jgi:membrane associated rhomboid family serine protease